MKIQTRRRGALATLAVLLPFGALLAGAVAACAGDVPTGRVIDGGDTGGDGEPAATTLSVFMTDAPGDPARAWVRVDDVVLTAEEDTLSLLDAPTGLVELTALATGTVSLVEERVAEPGSFRALRLVVGGAVVETRDEADEIEGVFTFRAEHPEGEAATGDLLCPACDASGFPVRLADGLPVEEGENGILLDFDVTRSFGREAGGTGAWVLAPLVNGAAVDPAAVGEGEVPGTRIAGGVILGTDEFGDPVEIPACPEGEPRQIEDFIPVASLPVAADGETPPLRFSGETAPDGAYAIRVLLPGDYELGFVDRRVVTGGSELVLDATVAPGSVTVPAGAVEVEGGDFTIGSADCEPATLG